MIKMMKIPNRLEIICYISTIVKIVIGVHALWRIVFGLEQGFVIEAIGDTFSKYFFVGIFVFVIEICLIIICVNMATRYPLLCVKCVKEDLKRQIRNILHDLINGCTEEEEADKKLESLIIADKAFDSIVTASNLVRIEAMCSGFFLFLEFLIPACSVEVSNDSFIVNFLIYDVLSKNFAYEMGKYFVLELSTIIIAIAINIKAHMMTEEMMRIERII